MHCCVRLKRERKEKQGAMKCEKCWRTVVKRNRCEKCKRLIGDDCGRVHDGKVIRCWDEEGGACRDCNGDKDDAGRPKQASYLAWSRRSSKEMTPRPREGARAGTLHVKNRGGKTGTAPRQTCRDAAGRLRRPAVLSGVGQDEGLSAGNERMPPRTTERDSEPPDTWVQYHVEREWTCWRCGVVWKTGMTRH